MISPELEMALHHSFVAARQARHKMMTPEHLLLQIVDEPTVVKHLEARSVNVAVLRTALQKFISNMDAYDPDEPNDDCQPTMEFQKIIQQAILDVQTNGRREVTLLDVLTVFLDRNKGLLTAAQRP